MLAEHWSDVRRARENGELEVAGVATFLGDTVTPTTPPPFERVKLSAVCWAYRRQTTRWSIGVWTPIPVPYRRQHDLVMHLHSDASPTTWRQLTLGGGRSAVEQGLVALMKRAPWALYGFTQEKRLAMSPGRCRVTTQEIEERRQQVMTNGVGPDWPGEEDVASAFASERGHRFSGATLD